MTILTPIANDTTNGRSPPSDVDLSDFGDATKTSDARVVDSACDVSVAMDPSTSSEKLDDMHWCSLSLLLPMIIAFSGGIVLGIVIAFTPLYLIMNELDTDCSLLTGEAACTSTRANCIWLEGNETCVFPNYEVVRCPATASHSTCVALEGCTFDEKMNVCKVESGWTAAQSGVFSGFAVLGAIVAPLVLPAFYTRFGAKFSTKTLGRIIIVGSALTNFGHHMRSFHVLVLARIVLGSGFGIGFALGGAYPHEMIPASKKRLIGILVALAIPWSCVLGIIISIILEPTDLASAPLHIDERVHGYTLVFYAAGLMFIATGNAMKESSRFIASQTRAHEIGKAAEATPTMLSFVIENKRALVATVFIFSLQQMTGLNAMSVYTPIIAKQLLGIRALFSTLIFNAWGGVFGLVGTFAVSRGFDPIAHLPRSTAILVATLCMSGAASMPGVIADETTKGIVVGICFLSVNGAYQALIGGACVQLALKLFSPEDVPRAMSFASAVRNVFVFTVITTFPVMVEGISGGPDQDQNVGIAGTLFFYAVVIAASCCMVQWLARPYSPPLLSATDEGEESNSVQLITCLASTNEPTMMAESPRNAAADNEALGECDVPQKEIDIANDSVDEVLAP